MARDLEQFREALNERIDAGGCTEAWATTEAVRNDRIDDAADEGAGSAGASRLEDTRRGLLRSTGTVTAGLAAVGFGANEAHAATSVDRRYSGDTLDRDAVERVVATEADALLEALAERGHIAEANPAGLEFDDVHVGSGLSRDTLRVSAGVHPEQGEYVRLSTMLPAEEFDRDLIVSVAPRLDTAAASAVKDGDAQLLRADTDGFVPLASSSSVDCWCESSSDCDCNCGHGFKYERYVCDGAEVYPCWEQFYECYTECSCGGWG